MHDFRRFAHGRGWRVVVLHAGERHLALYRGMGMRAVAIGDEAVLRPQQFSLDGRAIRKVRQSVSRLERAGYRIEVRTPAQVCARVRSQIGDVDREWLGGAPDRGLTMAMDDPFAHPDTRFMLAVAPDGSLGGYLFLVPHRHGYSLAAMRRRSDSPNGLMEWMICRTVDEARAAGADELSLNFAVFASLLRAGADSPRWMRAGRRAVIALDRAFQLDRLYSFNRKFSPDWRTRYICFERVIDVPVLSLATAHAEGLLPVADRLPERA